MDVAAVRPSMSALLTQGLAGALAVGRFGGGVWGIAMSSTPNTPNLPEAVYGAGCSTRLMSS